MESKNKAGQCQNSGKQLFQGCRGKKDPGKEIEEKYSEREKEPGQYNIPKVRGHLGSTTLMPLDTHLEYHFPCNLIQIELASSSLSSFQIEGFLQPRQLFAVPF